MKSKIFNIAFDDSIWYLFCSHSKMLSKALLFVSLFIHLFKLDSLNIRFYLFNAYLFIMRFIRTFSWTIWYDSLAQTSLTARLIVFPFPFRFIPLVVRPMTTLYMRVRACVCLLRFSSMFN